MKFRLIIVFGLLLMSCRLFGENKKAIQVKFTIPEKQYRIFYGSEVGNIEKECSTLMATFLDNTFKFFQFTDGANENVLHIELTNNERDLSTNSSLKEVGFKVFIKQPENLGSQNPVYWVFRPIERYIESLPDVNGEFIDEIIQSFKIGVSNNKEALVKNIFSKVEVAHNFHFIEDRKWFVLPLTEKENNIAKLSLFLIITSVPDDLIGSKESEVITKVVGNIQKELAVGTNHLAVTYPKGSLVVEKDKNDINDLPIELSDDGAVLKRIFILKYLPLENSDISIISPKSKISASNQ